MPCALYKGAENGEKRCEESLIFDNFDYICSYNLYRMAIDNLHIIILALGCNVAPEINMARMQTALASYFPKIRFTAQMVNQAIGIVAPPFTNCLAWMPADIVYSELYTITKNIEQELGSFATDRNTGVVVADIDILYCGGHKYHETDWKRPYIQQLLVGMLADED